MLKPNIHELVASRICHDLISPIGACANGTELLGMGGGEEEFNLIAQSAANASGRVRFFRIAFGHCEDKQTVSDTEIQSILKTMASDRLTFHVRIKGDVRRNEAQALFLAILCVERALPRGGNVCLKQHDDAWSISADAETMLITEALWTPLSNRRAPEEVIPATVSFALLPKALASLGRNIGIRMTDTRILMQF